MLLAGALLFFVRGGGDLMSSVLLADGRIPKLKEERYHGLCCIIVYASMLLSPTRRFADYLGRRASRGLTHGPQRVSVSVIWRHV